MDESSPLNVNERDESSCESNMFGTLSVSIDDNMGGRSVAKVTSSAGSFLPFLLTSGAMCSVFDDIFRPLNYKTLPTFGVSVNKLGETINACLY